MRWARVGVTHLLYDYARVRGILQLPIALLETWRVGGVSPPVSISTGGADPARSQKRIRLDTVDVLSYLVYRHSV